MTNQNTAKPEATRTDNPTRGGVSPSSYLAQEYERWLSLFELQPALLQRFYETQAHALAEALLQPATNARFALPERVVTEVSSEGKSETTVKIPPEQREQLVGGLMERLSRTTLSVALRQRLDELEASSNAGVSASA